MDEEKSGLSIGEIFGLIFTQKWLAIAIAVLITLAGTLGLYYGYNATKTYYSGSFSLVFPGSDSTTYPDNTPFSYRDMVSRQNILAVKELDEKFANIDAEDMYKSSGVSIALSDADDVNSISDRVYILKVKSSYFENPTQAEEFIKALAETPIRYLKSLSVNQDLFLKSFGETEFYETKANSLTEQMEYLQENNAKILGVTGGNLRISCQLLANKLSAFALELNSAIVEMRDKENMYVHNVQAVKDTYKSMTVTLDTKLKSKMRELELLFGKIQGSENVNLEQISPRVESLTAEIVQIEENKAIYEKYVAEDAVLHENPAFEQTLNELNTKLKDITDEFETNLDTFFKDYSLVVFEGAIRSEGGFSLLASVLISLAAGIIIAAIVAFIPGYIRFKRKSNAGKAEKKEEASPVGDGESNL